VRLILCGVGAEAVAVLGHGSQLEIKLQPGNCKQGCVFQLYMRFVTQLLMLSQGEFNQSRSSWTKVVVGGRR